MVAESPITSLQQQLCRDEGVRYKPYTDQVGKITIGVGRNLTDDGISASEMQMLLDHDMQTAARQLSEQVPWAATLDAVRNAVLANMCFNMGIHGLLGFRQFLSEMQMQAWDSAADAMLDSEWAKEVGPRAQRLAQQVRTGQWQ